MRKLNVRIRRPTPATIALGIVVALVALRVVTGKWRTDTMRHRDVTVAIVYDGDTFETTTGERVRLRGIDCPEVAHHGRPAQYFGAEATVWLRDLVRGKVVRLSVEIDESIDRYGRTLAWVYLGDELLNETALKSGHARLMDRFGLPMDLDPVLRAAASHAKAEKLGLWAPRSAGQAGSHTGL